MYKFKESSIRDQEDLPKYLKGDSFHFDDPGYFKCQQDGWSPDAIDAKDFDVYFPDLRLKRSVQNKIVEHMVLKLFSKQSIFSLVDILFKDMKEDYKLIEMESSEEDSDCEHGKEEEKALQE